MHKEGLNRLESIITEAWEEVGCSSFSSRQCQAKSSLCLMLAITSNTVLQCSHPPTKIRKLLLGSTSQPNTHKVTENKAQGQKLSLQKVTSSTVRSVCKCTFILIFWDHTCQHKMLCSQTIQLLVIS